MELINIDFILRSRVQYDVLLHSNLVSCSEGQTHTNWCSVKLVACV